MPGSVVQEWPLGNTGTTSNSAMTVSAASVANVNAADRIIVCVGRLAGASTPTDFGTPTDDDPAGSNAYTLLVEEQQVYNAPFFVSCAVFIATVATGGRRLTVTVTAGAQSGNQFSTLVGAAMECSGVLGGAGTNCLDVSATGTAGTTGMATTTGATDLAIAVAVDRAGTSTITTSSGAGSLNAAGFTKQITMSYDLSPNSDFMVALNPAVPAGSVIGGTYVGYTSTTSGCVVALQGTGPAGLAAATVVEG